MQGQLLQPPSVVNNLIQLSCSVHEVHSLTNILSKFVVDGEWTTDHTAPQESDGSSNVNNVLLPKDITKKLYSGPAATGIMSGVTPLSTTAALAGNVPKEAERDIRPESASSDVPEGFPETPFHDASEFNVDPIPATSGIGNPVNLAPGEKVPHPSTLTSNTVSSTARDDPSLKKSPEDSEQAFGVAPLPATTGTGNPVSLQPGEKVPHPSEFTQNTTESHVTTDKESYENAGGAPQLPGIVTSDKEGEALGGMFKMPGIGGTMIPESSLPMGAGAASEIDKGPMIQSAGAQSSTAALAGNVPLEPRGVPEIVQASQQEAGLSSEASENKEAVQEKSAMEKELEKKVPEEPAASENTGTAASEDTDASGGGMGKGTAMAAGGVVAGGAVAAVTTASHGLPSSVQQSIDEMNKGSAIAPTVPDVVQESITESHQSPEAAGDKTMVGEKSAMEKELLSGVKREDDVGEPAPSSSAALTETAPAPTGSENVPPPISKDPAPLTSAAMPAQTPATANSMKQAVKSEPDSRDISPMSKPIKQTQNQTQPIVTTGVGSSAAPQKSQQPDKAVPAAKPSPAADKKSKRASGFFGKLKSKFSDKK